MVNHPDIQSLQGQNDNFFWEFVDQTEIFGLILHNLLFISKLDLFQWKKFIQVLMSHFLWDKCTFDVYLKYRKLQFCMLFTIKLLVDSPLALNWNTNLSFLHIITQRLIYNIS